MTVEEWIIPNEVYERLYYFHGHPLIRCKDCKHYDDKHEVCCVYLSYRLAKNEDDFCSDAERREE